MNFKGMLQKGSWVNPKKENPINFFRPSFKWGLQSQKKKLLIEAQTKC